MRRPAAMSPAWGLLWFGAFWSIALLSRVGAADGELLVGWAAADITPDLSGGRKVALRGLLIPRVTAEVRTPLMATVLALESQLSDGKSDAAILITCDTVTPASSFADGASISLVNLLRERLRGKLLGFDERKLIFSATHTHNAPAYEPGLYDTPDPNLVTSDEYRDYMLRRIEAAAIEAWTARKPGKMAWALTHAAVGYNRRVVYADGKAVMGGWRSKPNFELIEGGDDHGLELLFFWDANDRLTGVVANVPCPSQGEIQDNVISADYWGEVRRQLAKKEVFAGAFILTQAGAAGDLWPFQQVRDKAEADMRARRGLTLSGEIARRIVDAMQEVLAYAWPRREAHLAVAHRVEEIKLPLRQLTAAQLMRLRSDVGNLERMPESNPIRFNLLKRGQRALDQALAAGEPPPLDVEVHVLRIGDVVLATSPFELFVDYGARIKARSPATMTMLVELANGVGAGGAYLPTARAIEAGGYSADPLYNNCPVGPAGAAILVDRTVAAIAGLWKGSKE